MSLPLFSSSTKHELLHPVDKSPTGLVLELNDMEHDDVYNAQMSVVKEARSKGITHPAEIAQSIEAQVRVAAAALVGWEIKNPEWEQHFKDMGLEGTAYSKENAIKFLSNKRASWIRAQIETVLGDRKRFFQTELNA